jgi:phosphotransferase system HPr (HPr) family protein
MTPQEINLTPAELKAIEDHKYFLSQERGAEVTIEEAIADFLARFGAEWRHEKLREDNRQQRDEIEKHLYLRSVTEGRDIGRAAAADEWCRNYAAVWRAARESLERNGFLRATVTIQNPREMHLRPMSSIGQLATRFDCDIYIHRPAGMTYWNLMLDNKPYMHVKSVLGFLSLGLAVGDTVEFIATGAQAGAALAELTRLMETTISPAPPSP